MLSASSLAIAMDKTPIHQEIVIKEITAISNPNQVSSLNNNNALLISNPEGIYTVDWKENKKTDDILTGKYTFGILPNKQKTAVVVTPIEEGISIRCKKQLFDIETKKLIWEDNFDINPSFEPSGTFTRSGNLYMVKGDGNIHCSNGKYYYAREAGTGYKGIITSDPTEEKIFFVKTDNIANQLKSSLCTTTFNEDLFPQVSSVELPKNSTDDIPYARLHSPISKLIALCYPLSIIWNIFDQSKKIATDVPDCCLLAFHPNKPFLGILTKDGFVEIRDVIKQTIMAKTNESLGTPKDGTAANEGLIDFSQDGENLAVIVNNKCFVLSNLYPKNN